MLRAPVEDAYDGPEQGRPGLVVKCDDNWGWLELRLPVQGPAGLTPGVGDLPVAGDLVARLLVELVPAVLVLPSPQSVPLDVGVLSKVLPVDPPGPKARLTQSPATMTPCWISYEMLFQCNVFMYIALFSQTLNNVEPNYISCMLYLFS